MIRIPFGPKLLLFLTIASSVSLADTITIGAPGNPDDGDCAPFGCAVEYQQVYGSGQFSGAISITGLTFFNDNFVPGSIAAADYTISLSTTAVAVDGLSAMFANNLGTNNQVFFSGMLGGLIGPTNQFTLTGTPFTYNPATGNLLLTVASNGGGQDYSVFLDYLSGAPVGTFSRAYSFDNSGTASNLDGETGLVTQFIFSPVSSTVPEPASWTLFASAVSAVLAVSSVKRAMRRLKVDHCSKSPA